MLQGLGGLDTLYAEPEEITGLAVTENNGGEARAKRRVAYLSYQLATIKTDVQLELTCERLEVRQPAAEELWGCSKSLIQTLDC
ncbi:hypothetical protein ACNKHP_14240 [Shigella boydii]